MTNGKRGKILIVDDDESVLMTLQWVLEGEGYSTATAWSGREALDLLRRGDFDLLLVDGDLRDVETKDLFNRLKAEKPQALCFLMGAQSDKAAQPLPGIDATVCKWEHGEIATKIRNCLAS